MITSDALSHPRKPHGYAHVARFSHVWLLKGEEVNSSTYLVSGTFMEFGFVQNFQATKHSFSPNRFSNAFWCHVLG